MIAQPLDLNIPSECPACGIAGGIVRRIGHDRYGNDSYTLHCVACGFGWWRNVKPPEWYANLYESGDYRKMVSEYHRRDVMATIEADQAEYARRLSQKIHPRPHTTLLDIGGSTGVISNAFRRVFNVSATVMDPSPEFSAPQEVKHIRASAEDYQNDCGLRWDTILMCQTVDHLRDPISVIRNCRKWLNDGGQFFVDILDARAEQRRKGWEHTIKIDHPSIWTKESMVEVLCRAGFSLIGEPWESEVDHIGFLCK